MMTFAYSFLLNVTKHQVQAAVTARHLPGARYVETSDLSDQTLCVCVKHMDSNIQQQLDKQPPTTNMRQQQLSVAPAVVAAGSKRSPTKPMLPLMPVSREPFSWVKSRLRTFFHFLFDPQNKISTRSAHWPRFRRWQLCTTFFFFFS